MEPELIYKLQMHATPTWIHIQIYRIHMMVATMQVRPVSLAIIILQFKNTRYTHWHQHQAHRPPNLKANVFKYQFLVLLFYHTQ